MRKLVLFSLLTAFPAIAVAGPYDAAFYTNGNFQLVVDAFKRVALFYGQANFWMVGVFAAGLIAAGVVAAVNGTAQRLSGGGEPGAKFLSSLVFAGVGLLVFAAGIVPKGDLHIYDDHQNRYEMVADVPALITIPFGAVSSIIEAFRDSESTANAYPYGELASGSPFVLLKEALSTTDQFSSDLLVNIETMYADCASSAIADGRLNVDTLRGGTYDVWGSLSALRHNSLQTTIRTSVYPTGQGMTCAEAYDHIQVELADPTTFDRQLSSVCAAIGLNSSNAAEKATCLDQLTRTFDTVYSRGAGALDGRKGLENLLVGNAIAAAYRDSDGGSSVNIDLSRKTLAESMGAMEASARFVPIIQGVMLSVIIAATPALFLFIMTPLLGKALKLYFGLIGFYGLWILVDMTTLSAMEDSLYAATSHIVRNQMGLLSIWQSSTAVIDSFSILGTARTIGLSVAMLLTASLFGVSAYGLSSFANKAEGTVESAGREAGREAMLNEYAGEKMDSLVKGNANMAALTTDFSGAVRAETLDRMTGIRAGNIEADNLGGVNNAAGALAENRASGTVGAAQATAQEGFDQAVAAERVAQEQVYADGAATQKIAGMTGTTTRDMMEDISIASQGKDAGAAAELGADGNLAGNAILRGMDTGAKDRAIAHEVDEHGTDASYLAQRHAHQEATERAKTVEGMTGGSTRNYFADIARRETADSQGKNIASQGYSDGQLRAAAAGDAIEGIEGSLTRTDLAGGSLGDRAQLAENSSTMRTADDMAEWDLRNAIANALHKNEVEVASMMIGGNQMNLSLDDAYRAHDAGIISDEQLRMAEQEGAMVLDLNATASPSQGLQVQSASASFRDNVDVDKSTRRDESITHDHSTLNMNEASSMVLFGDADKFQGYMQDLKAANRSDAEIATTIGVGSASGLRNLVDFRTDDVTEGKTEGSLYGRAYAGVEAPSLLGLNPVTGGIEGGAEVRGSKADVHVESRSENVAAQHFAGVYQQIASHYGNQVDAGELRQHEADERIAEAYTGYYSYVRDQMATGEIGEFNRFIANGSLDNVWAQYNEDSKLGIGEPVGPPEGYINDAPPELNKPEVSHFQPSQLGSSPFGGNSLEQAMAAVSRGDQNMPLAAGAGNQGNMPPADPERASGNQNLPKVTSI